MRTEKNCRKPKHPLAKYLLSGAAAGALALSPFAVQAQTMNTTTTTTSTTGMKSRSRFLQQHASGFSCRCRRRRRNRESAILSQAPVGLACKPAPSSGAGAILSLSGRGCFQVSPPLIMVGHSFCNSSAPLPKIFGSDFTFSRRAENLGGTKKCVQKRIAVNRNIRWRSIY